MTEMLHQASVKRESSYPLGSFLFVFSMVLSLGYAIASPVLMELIRPRDTAALFVYFGFGCMFAGPLMVGVLAGLMTYWNPAVRMVVGSVVVFLGFQLNRFADWCCDGLHSIDMEYSLLVPAMMCGLCLPYWIAQFIWNCRIEFPNAIARSTRFSISGLLILTAVLAAAIQCGTIGSQIIPDIDTTALWIAVGVVSLVSLVNLLLFVWPFFRFHNVGMAVAFATTMILLLSLVAMLINTIVTFFGPGMGTWEYVCAATTISGFAVTHLMWLAGLRLIGASLNSGHPEPRKTGKPKLV